MARVNPDVRGASRLDEQSAFDVDVMGPVAEPFGDASRRSRLAAAAPSRAEHRPGSGAAASASPAIGRQALRVRRRALLQGAARAEPRPVHYRGSRRLVGHSPPAARRRSRIAGLWVFAGAAASEGSALEARCGRRPGASGLAPATPLDPLTANAAGAPICHTRAAASIRAHRGRGVVAKRGYRGSTPGLRSGDLGPPGAWQLRSIIRVAAVGPGVATGASLAWAAAIPGWIRARRLAGWPGNDGWRGSCSDPAP
jgi:hypothetical protein